MSTLEKSIVFTGDIGFVSYMEGKWEDESLLSDEVLAFLHSGDHVVANVEGALISMEEAEDVRNKGIFFHTMDPEATKVLRKMKADIWCFANNHTIDAGLGGIRNSIKLADACGAKAFGAGENIEEASRPIYLDEAGGIGMVGIGYMPVCVRATETEAGVFGWDELERIGQVIKQIKSKCRWCVVVCHGGEEFSVLPAPYTRDLYLKYLELGADIVVGHHPHVPLNYELIEDKAIFYSLGNFIFDTNYQRAQANTEKGVLLKLKFTEDCWSFEAVGTRLVRGEEKIVAGDLPGIFENVPEKEYYKLLPMAAKAFLTNERKKMQFRNPSIYMKYTEEQWHAFYHDDSQRPRVKGFLRDLAVYEKYAKQAENGEFEKSSLENVKQYILELI